jgi:glycosyltransferase involved in cell wall biosynthesis
MENLISILIPTYKRSKLIGETIQSCLNQTYKNIEIVIYDDGSNDNTDTIVNKFISSNSNIRYIKGDKNLGVGHARNVLLENINGSYACWLDSDDLMEPNRLEINLNSIGENDIMYSSIRRIGYGTGILDIDITKYDKKDWNSLKYNTTCATGFFKKSVSVVKFVEDIKSGGEDVLWLWYLIHNDIKVGYIKKPLYLYRQHDDRIGVHKRNPAFSKIKEDEATLFLNHINKYG